MKWEAFLIELAQANRHKYTYSSHHSCASITSIASYSWLKWNVVLTHRATRQEQLKHEIVYKSLECLSTSLRFQWLWPFVGMCVFSFFLIDLRLLSVCYYTLPTYFPPSISCAYLSILSKCNFTKRKSKYFFVLPLYVLAR